MTFETAERACEAQERAEYSALQGVDPDRLMIEEQIITGYLSDAWEGSDDDWIVCDSNRTNDALLKILEEQIITGYLSDAWEGSDDDWIVCDSNRTNDALLKILAVVRQRSAEPREQVDSIRSIILAMQAAGAMEHLEHLSAKGVL